MQKEKKPTPPAKGLVAQHGRWYLPQRIGGRQKWHALTRVDAGEAAVLEALAALLRDQGKPVPNMPTRLMEFKRDGLKHLSHGVRREYERIYDALAVGLREFNTETITSFDIKRALKQYEDVPTMRRAIKARLSTFFRWCCADMGYSATNPVTQVHFDEVPKRDVRVDPESFWKIHDALPSPRPEVTKKGKKPKWVDTGLMAQCLLQAFYLVVQRTTELRLLRQDQIREGFIHFKPTKTAKTSQAKMRVRVTPALQGVLDRAAAIRRTYKSESMFYVFPTPTGSPYSARHFLGIWNRALERCELGESGFVPKDILPSVMTDAVESGYTLEELRAARGHASVTTTEGYMRQRVEVESPIDVSLPARKSKP